MINNLLNKFGFQLNKVSKKYNEKKLQNPQVIKPNLIRSDEFGDLYNCKYEMKLYLNHESYVDSMILKNNIWEKDSVNIVQKIVKPGQTVLDVGANFGYYSIMFSKLVGKSGKVISSEPTTFFGEKFKLHLNENKCLNVELLPFGFSDKETNLEIKIDNATASMHMPEYDEYLKTESIKLIPLDQFAVEKDLKQLDFIKIDIDGHEPKFLDGAKETISKFQPDILLEINPLNYYLAGVTIWDFYDQIKGFGYNIYHEKNLEEISNKIDFLKRCGNFGWQGNWKAPFSLNVLLTHKSSEELSKIFS